MTEKELRNKVVTTFQGYLGCKESDGSHRKIVDLYNSHKPLARGYKLQYDDAWCAGAVSAVSIACGLTDIMPTEVGCGPMITLYQKLGRWQENDAYIPQAGDVIFYDWDDSGSGDNRGSSDHVGVVVYVSGNTIKVIEGNKNNAVGYRTLAINGKYIRGYGLPDYASKATAAPAETKPATPAATKKEEYTMNMRYLRKDAKGEDVKALQILLAGRGYKCGSYGPNKDGVDGDYGAATENAVRAYQSANGLTVDGEAGPQTMGSLLGV